MMLYAILYLNIEVIISEVQVLLLPVRGKFLVLSLKDKIRLDRVLAV